MIQQGSTSTIVFAMWNAIINKQVVNKKFVSNIILVVSKVFFLKSPDNQVSQQKTR